MRYRLSQIKTDIDEPMERLPSHIARILRIDEKDIAEWEIRRKSIDSRKKPHIQFVYTADFVVREGSGSEAGLARRAGAGPHRARGRRKGQTLPAGLAAVDEEAEAAAVRAPEPGREELAGRPVVVGMGPAGLFAALELAKAGYRPLVLERGPAMEGRVRAVNEFKARHVLDPEANMLFGEGGAGTFSDGKLGTGIKDSLIRLVLAEFRDAGAGDEIMYLAKPHIGTDVLRGVIVNIRRKIEALGGEILFDTKLEALVIEDGRLTGAKILRRCAPQDDRKECCAPQDDRKECCAPQDDRRTEVPGGRYDGGKASGGRRSESRAQAAGIEEQRIETNALVLAAGHSARDTFVMLNDAGLAMQQKPFSIGVRIEHPQSLIDAAQYGEDNLSRVTDAVTAERLPGKLPPADYKVNHRASNGRGVYSFCMCPGGEVVVCSTKDGELCVNGMSGRRRGSGTANSGILCDVRTEDFGSDDVLAGVRFQEKYERLAFANGGGSFSPPRCRMKDFTDASVNDEGMRRAAAVLGSLPEFASEAIREAIPEFARRINGYDDPEAVITAVETRSSSPVRMLRDGAGESNIKGIYPAGEGAGYAGGITSAACDGIRSAWHIIEKYKKPQK